MSDRNKKHDNMLLWNAVKEIDINYTKKAKVGGVDVTSFSLHSVLQLATEQWGKFGKGWGYDIEKERFDKGILLQNGVTFENGDSQPEIWETTHTLLIKLWYMDDGEKIVCPVQAGHTPYIMRTNYGPKHDGEYYKKSLTDAIKKSLSMLGFAADIFLGLHDDHAFLEIKESEKQLKESSELPAKIEAFGDDVVRRIELFDNTSMGHSVTALYKNLISFIHQNCKKLDIKPDVYIQKADDAYAKRMDDLRTEAEKKAEKS